MNTERRVGIIHVPEEFIEDQHLWEMLLQLKFVPFKVEHEVWMERYIYTGESPFFETLQDGCVPQIYTPTMTQLPQYKYKVGLK